MAAVRSGCDATASPPCGGVRLQKSRLSFRSFPGDVKTEEEQIRELIQERIQEQIQEEIQEISLSLKAKATEAWVNSVLADQDLSGNLEAVTLDVSVFGTASVTETTTNVEVETVSEACRKTGAEETLPVAGASDNECGTAGAAACCLPWLRWCCRGPVLL
jgi:hypothetical protein